MSSISRFFILVFSNAWPSSTRWLGEWMSLRETSRMLRLKSSRRQRICAPRLWNSRIVIGSTSPCALVQPHLVRLVLACRACFLVLLAVYDQSQCWRTFTPSFLAVCSCACDLGLLRFLRRYKTPV